MICTNPRQSFIGELSRDLVESCSASSLSDTDGEIEFQGVTAEESNDKSSVADSFDHCSGPNMMVRTEIRKYKDEVAGLSNDGDSKGQESKVLSDHQDLDSCNADKSETEVKQEKVDYVADEESQTDDLYTALKPMKHASVMKHKISSDDENEYSRPGAPFMNGTAQSFSEDSAFSVSNVSGSASPQVNGIPGAI